VQDETLKEILEWLKSLDQRLVSTQSWFGIKIVWNISTKLQARFYVGPGGNCPKPRPCPSNVTWNTDELKASAYIDAKRSVPWPFKYPQNAFPAGDLPRTLLAELITLPRLPSRLEGDIPPTPHLTRCLWLLDFRRVDFPEGQYPEIFFSGIALGAIACLSSQVQCEFMNCYIVYFAHGE